LALLGLFPLFGLAPADEADFDLVDAESPVLKYSSISLSLKLTNDEIGMSSF
jgi:hypothetical protein